jgi:FkbM family methyltransferase
LYGAGVVGNDFVTQIEKTGFCQIICVLDRNAEHIPLHDEIQVFPPEHIAELVDYDYIVLSVSLLELAEEMMAFLREMGISDDKILFCEDRNTWPGASKKIIYALDGCDYLMWWFFLYLGVEKPCYIDIGAHHPFLHSNTAIFYREGCRGINIEANPELVEEIAHYRPEDITLNIGIGTAEGAMPFYVFGNTGLSTFSSEQAAHIRNELPQLTQTVINVPVSTINKVIEEYAGGEWPHFMNLDIEGLEFDVLSATDFSHGGPYAITVEVNKLDIKELNELMKGKGYATYCRLLGNIVYAREDVLARLYDLNPY